ncbi:YcxB family protein [Parablautia muri]|uniref:YcxB family protein n=1 Tax=Parablautia muri TaxID=2320879 RepID=A0A9X5BDS5_9FIRM|nr:YcxB family protein [Parablautia muri]NBJ91768.1 YcxB family protein [Parablautia muri]
MILLIKSFPQLVGDKRFKERMLFAPSAKRSINFYDEYVEVKGKFSQKLPYKELKRTGQTRSLYLLFFTERRIVILHKAGFRKGTLAELKEFIKEHRPFQSKIYGIIRYLPAVMAFVLFVSIFWSEF